MQIELEQFRRFEAEAKCAALQRRLMRVRTWCPQLVDGLPEAKLLRLVVDADTSGHAIGARDQRDHVWWLVLMLQHQVDPRHGPHGPQVRWILSHSRAPIHSRLRQLVTMFGDLRAMAQPA